MAKQQRDDFPRPRKPRDSEPENKGMPRTPKARSTPPPKPKSKNG